MSKIARLTCACLLGSAGLFAQSTVPGVVKTTGVVGVAEDQTARLNLLNPGVLPPATGPATGVICTANVTFMNAAGAVVKSAAVAVAPGKSVGVNLDSQADLNLAVGARQEIRVVITEPGASSAVGPCKLIPTLEVFDSLNGRTLVVLGRAEAVPTAN